MMAIFKSKDRRILKNNNIPSQINKMKKIKSRNKIRHHLKN
jgi:hypothetical protein